MLETVEMVAVSESTRWIMDQTQLIALGFMALMYTIKIFWILKRKPMKERTPARGNESAAIRYAYMTLAMPWELESMRKHPMRYIEFVIFHIGVAVAIGATFVLPYAPWLLGHRITIWALQGILGLALLAGLSRLVRRVAVPYMRVISSMDDYFSMILLNVWLASAIWGVMQTSEAGLLLYFGLTAFFLVYVPFSKISHYLLWPFVRFYMGKHFGHRGVFPKKMVKSQAA